jgi:hypothetical protein
MYIYIALTSKLIQALFPLLTFKEKQRKRKNYPNLKTDSRVSQIFEIQFRMLKEMEK